MSTTESKTGQPNCPKCGKYDKSNTIYETPSDPKEGTQAHGPLVNYCTRCKVQFDRV